MQTNTGKNWTKAHNLPLELYPANWSKYSDRAGMVRNEQMARNAQALIAIWDGSSTGTAHMIQIAKIQGLQVFIHKFKIQPLPPPKPVTGIIKVCRELTNLKKGL